MAETKFREKVLEQIEKDLTNWQEQYEGQCADILADVKR
jgi:hypothetical protein